MVALVIGASFTLLQLKTPWTEVQVARRERAAHPDAGRTPKAMRSLVIVLAMYAVLGVAFYLGWHQAGVSGGALAAIAVACVGVLVAAGFAIKSAWVSSK